MFWLSSKWQLYHKSKNTWIWDRTAMSHALNFEPPTNLEDSFYWLMSCTWGGLPVEFPWRVQFCLGEYRLDKHYWNINLDSTRSNHKGSTLPCPCARYDWIGRVYCHISMVSAIWNVYDKGMGKGVCGSNCWSSRKKVTNDMKFTDTQGAISTLHDCPVPILCLTLPHWLAQYSSTCLT